jgi:hypothetical protein
VNNVSRPFYTVCNLLVYEKSIRMIIKVEMQSQEGSDCGIDFIPCLIIPKCLCIVIFETDKCRKEGKEGMLCSNWLGLIAAENQDVALETILFKDSYIGFPRATLLREGTISFDFLVACIRSSCVINKLTQHLQLRLTQCQLQRPTGTQRRFCSSVEERPELRINRRRDDFMFKLIMFNDIKHVI